MNHTITTKDAAGESTFKIGGDVCLDVLSKLSEDARLAADEAINDGASPDDVAFILCNIVNGAFFDRAEKLHLETN